MSRSRHDDYYWRHRAERGLEQAVAGRSGFAWGVFFIGFILGGIIF